MSQAGSATGGGGGGGGSNVYNYTTVTTTPYVVQTNDVVMGVNTSIPITIKLPDAPATGRYYIVKDLTGLAVINNITVTTVGGTVLIDLNASIAMNTSLQGLNFLFNGTKYLIY